MYWVVAMVMYTEGVGVLGSLAGSSELRDPGAEALAVGVGVPWGGGYRKDRGQYECGSRKGGAGVFWGLLWLPGRSRRPP